MDFINIIGTFFDNSIEHVVALASQIKDLRLNKNQQDINEDIYNEIEEIQEENEEIKQDIVLLKEEDQKINNNTRITFIEEDLESVHQEFAGLHQEIEDKHEQINQKVDSKFEEIDEDLNSVHNQLEIISDIDVEELKNIGETIEDIHRDTKELDERITEIESHGSDGIKHRLVSQREYEALESYERNTLYIIVDFDDHASVFGDKFPFILGGGASKFGDTFPFTLGSSEASHFGDDFPLIFN